MTHPTPLSFEVANTETWQDGRQCVHSTAYMAMKAFEATLDDLDRALEDKRQADAAAAEAAVRYSTALDELAAELEALYGDAMPAAFQMSEGVLVLDDVNSPRYIKSTTWADTYRIEGEKQEAP